MNSKVQLQNNGKITGFLEIKAKDDDNAELIIYGDISCDKWGNSEVTPTEVTELLAPLKNKNLNIYINSSGGNVFAGLAIYHMLKRHKGKKIVYVDGIAASIASIIAMVGDEIHIPQNSYLMIHRAWICASGNKNELQEIVALLDKTDLNLVDIYKSKALDNITEDKILELMDNETWLTGIEAQNYFNIILDKEKEVKACLNNSYSKMPKALKNIEKRQRINEEKERQAVLIKLKQKLGIEEE